VDNFAFVEEDDDHLKMNINQQKIFHLHQQSMHNLNMDNLIKNFISGGAFMKERGLTSMDMSQLIQPIFPFSLATFSHKHSVSPF
jgi:hypothetical protein